MSSDVRWMTTACAKKFVKAQSPELAFENANFGPIFTQFRSQNPKTWFVEGDASSSMRDRRVGRKSRAPRPGPRTIGQVKINTPALRAWVWEDDLSVIQESLGKPHYWMIAVGKRSKDSPQHDLQEIGKSILHDPDDSWRPTLDDYRELQAHLAEEYRRANREAIYSARKEAHTNRNEAVSVSLQDHSAEIAEEYIADTNHQGVVIEFFSIRFFMVSVHYRDGTYVPMSELEALASIAFDDLPDHFEWGLTNEDPDVDGLTLDRERAVCFAAELAQ